MPCPEAIRDWVTNVKTTHYILGSVAGPHPYAMMVREFHAVIGKETRKQALEIWGGKSDVLVACVGGGSNAMGLFHEFVNDKDVRLIGVEAAGHGLDSGKHAATFTKGEVGVLHGAMSYLLQDDDEQIVEPHSISAGLDYPGVGPEHSFLKDEGHAECYSVTDDEALEDDEYLLPGNLISLCISKLENLETLTRGLNNLILFQLLEIIRCHKVRFLPSEGLPSSLGRLRISDCPLLRKECFKWKGHIPCVELDDECI
ncbi:hypothetical protein LWI28_013187 [Acer negundo]|uniref:tryptophan synthase n=1 Tax=Acer negundo TaxID=4023 RepID=A0AAD5NXX7_ACENE|nr:hypothetical protein LWI28_013187 [Acer negundo]